MPRIYCNQCFSNAAVARDQLQGSPLNHISEFVCGQGHALPRQLLARHEMNAPAQTRFLYNRAPVPPLLSHWINAATGPERANRMEVIDRLHAQGAVLSADDQVIFVNGNIDLSNLTHLKELPPNLHISGNLDLTGCHSLSSFPRMLVIQGSLTVKGCHSLEELSSAHLSVSGNTYISECNSMKALSLGGLISFGGSAYIDNCPVLKAMAANVTCHGDMAFSFCPELQEMPIALAVDRDLSFQECHKLAQLGENYSIGQDLSVMSCRQFSGLPQVIQLGRYLDISDNPSLATVPTWVFNLSTIPNMEATAVFQPSTVPTHNQPNAIASNTSNYALDFGSDDHEMEFVAEAMNAHNRNFNIESELRPELAHIFGDLGEYGDIDVGASDYFVQVETTPGQELNDLVTALKQNPLAPLNVNYKGNKAVDNGGVSKQALDFALQQILADKFLVVQHTNGQYALNVDTTSPEKSRDFLEKSHELGLILGKMMDMNNATGYSFRPEFDRHLFDAHQFLYKISNHGSKSAEDYVLELVESTNKKRLVKLVQEVMKSQFKDTKQLDFLKSLPSEDFKDYTTEAASYLIIANEMQNCGVDVSDDFDDFEQLFAGPSDPKALMIENLKYEPSIYADKNTFLANKLVEWFMRAVQEASKDQLKRLTMDLTGSSFSTEKTPIYLKFSAFNDNRILFNTHSCSRELDVNFTKFKAYVNQDRFDIFKYDLLQAGSSIFNGS